MPTTSVVFYRESDGSIPIVDWLDSLHPKVQVKCLVRLKRLEELGHELRRPEADLLRDGIYELRVGHRGLNHRILYFFHGERAVVVSHGLIKERRVPSAEIDAAIARKTSFESAPERHAFRPE